MTDNARSSVVETSPTTEHCTLHNRTWLKPLSCDLCSQEQAGFVAGGVPDLVNHPAHYKVGEVECIDAIQSALSETEFLGYCKGSALKYIWREEHKGGKQDIAKAIWYLERILEE